MAALDGHGENIDEFRYEVENEVRYANIAIIEGTGASQLGIGMATARIVEAILRDEQAVMPVGAFNPNYGTTLSLPSVLGRAGVSRILRAPGYVAPTHHRNMYMYVPRHSTRTHRTSTNGRY